MKKVFMGMFALATMLLTNSCSNDEIISQSSGNEVTVSFTAELRGDIKTRAVGDDTECVDQMVFAVYDESGSELSELQQTITSFTDAEGGKKTAKVEVVLVKGQTYSFAFWAQDKDYAGYKFTPADKKVTVSYEQTANNKSADAFWAVVNDYKVNGSFEMNVTLKRPLAQINFLVTAEELAAAKKAGFEPSQSSVVVKQAATSLNVLTGAVEGSTDATFNLAALITGETTTIKDAEGKYIALKKDGTGFVGKMSVNDATDFQYLATAYFLPTEATAATTISASMQVVAASESKAPVDLNVATLTAQRNYRTNIYGSLLTSNGQIYVTVDPASDGDHSSEYEDQTTNVVGTVAEANALFNPTDNSAPATNVTITEAPTSDAELILPQTTEDVTINFAYETNASSTAKVTIKYAENATSKPENITVNGDTNELVIEAPNSTVTLNGSYSSVTATTANNTLIVPKGVTITNLTLKQGNARIYYGAVTNLTKEKGYNGTITWLVDSKEQLQNIASAVNGGTFSGNIELTDDINLNNEAWTPIGLNADDAKKFHGTFDGKGHTIKNLNVATDAGYTAAGFFGALNGTAKNFTIDGASISHISTGSASDNGIAVVAGSIYNTGSIDGVTVKNATVEGNRYLGGISGFTYGSVTNCVVENITLTATPDMQSNNSYDNGDKVGGIAGYFASESTYSFSGNSVTNATIKGYRDLGGIVGCAHGADYVTNNTVNGLSVTADQTTYHYEDKSGNVGSIVGRITKGTLENSNSASNVTELTTVVVETKDLATILNENATTLNITLVKDVELQEFQKITAANISIDGGASNHRIQLTTTYWNRFANFENANAKLSLSNLTLDGAGSIGTWNGYDIIFTCDVEMNNVTFNRAIAIDENITATLTGVKINETKDKYALWIVADGSEVTLNNCEITASNGRAIKISDEYEKEPALVKLNVSGTKFTSKSKAAILVGSLAGANITLSNIDITNVTADKENAVWVDNGTKSEAMGGNGEKYSDYKDLVTVTGGTVIVEP